MRIIVFIILLWFSALPATFAGTPQCTPIPLKAEGGNITLPGTQDPKKSLTYFFENKSLQSVWIDHPDQKRRGASAGWASYLRPGNWSAIVLNKKNFIVSCATIQPGKVETLDCSKTLSVCTPQNMMTTVPLEGNVWLAEDKKWERFLVILTKRGITFP